MPKKQPLDIESTFAQLEATIQTLESGDSNLQGSLEAFEQGVRLIKQAQAALQEASQKVNLLLEDGQDSRSTPFKDESPE